MEKNDLTINIENGLSGDIEEIAVQIGDILLNAFDIFASACIIMRRIYHNLEDYDKDFIKSIEKDAVKFISPVMDAYTHPECIAVQLADAFDQVDNRSKQLFNERFNFGRINYEDKSILDNLRVAQGELFFEIARESEKMLLETKSDKLKLDLNQLEKLWSNQSFQQIKGILIEDCDFVCEQTKEYINFVESKMEEYESEGKITEIKKAKNNTEINA